MVYLSCFRLLQGLAKLQGHLELRDPRLSTARFAQAYLTSIRGAIPGAIIGAIIGAILGLTAAIMLLISPCRAESRQSGSETQAERIGGGRCAIQGSVQYPGGRRLDHRAKVTLRGGSTPERFTLTDDNGAFAFSGLSGGSYTVTVDAGNDYELATESVEILESGRQGEAARQIVSVQLELQARPAAPQQIGTVSVVSDEALAIYKEALATADAGNRKRAAELLQRAVSICPDFWTAWNELGVQHLRLKQTARALDALRTARKLKPEAFAPHLNIGIAFLQVKDYVNAADELQQALRRKPDSALAHFHLGHALLALNRFAEAELELNEAIKLGSDAGPEAHRLLAGVYIEQHKESRAADELERYLTLSPGAHDAARIRDIIRELRNPLAKK